MKRITTSILFTLIGYLAFSQADNLAMLELALAEGNRMSEAYQNGDYDTFLDLAHPKFVEMSGGRAKMKEMLKKGLGPGVEIVSTELTIAKKIIARDSLLQCAMSQRQVMSVNGQKSYTIGTLIGISYDTGKTWYFIGVANNSLPDLQRMFPELNNDLDVKPQSYPILIKEQ